MDTTEENGTHKLVEKAEDMKKLVLKHGFRVMPHLARLFLLGTFLDDGVRMIFQWGLQVDYIVRAWEVNAILAGVFVLINMVGQLASSALILLRRKELVACFILYGLIILQIIVYNLASVPIYLMRNLSLIGAVTMLLAESQPTSRELLNTQLPSFGKEDIRRTLSQFLGRILLALMFMTLLRFEFSYGRIIETVVGSILLVLIVVGYKTKEVSLLLGLWLYVLNFYLNSWWTLPAESVDEAETKKFDFFQTLSVVGGFFLVVSVGPGSISLDELKKKD